MSRVIQSKHARIACARCVSSIYIKVDAKLGGASNDAMFNGIPKLRPTVVVGTDVSHPANFDISPKEGGCERYRVGKRTTKHTLCFSRKDRPWE
jgi:hypothetical protein